MSKVIYGDVFCTAAGGNCDPTAGTHRGGVGYAAGKDHGTVTGFHNQVIKTAAGRDDAGSIVAVINQSILHITYNRSGFAENSTISERIIFHRSTAAGRDIKYSVVHSNIICHAAGGNINISAVAYCDIFCHAAVYNNHHGCGAIVPKNNSITCNAAGGNCDLTAGTHRGGVGSTAGKDHGTVTGFHRQVIKTAAGAENTAIYISEINILTVKPGNGCPIISTDICPGGIQHRSTAAVVNKKIGIFI